jgi:chromosome segregation ATPase
MTLNDAVAALKAHARQLEAVQVIAAAIQDVAAIDQLTDEAEQRRVARQLEVDAAHARLIEVEKRAATVEESIKAAQQRASDILAKAQSSAVEIAAKAKEDAVSAAEKASAEATKTLKGLNADVEKAKADLASLLTASNDMNASLAAKAKELAEIEDKIAKARAIVAGVMG